MTKKTIINKVAINIMFLVIVFVFLFAVNPVFAEDPAPSATATEVCKGIGLAGGDCSNGGGAGDKVNNLVATIINVFSWVVGAIAVIMLIFGGFKYVTSGGDTNKVKAAKDTIIYALIGVAVVVFSQLLVQFVIGASEKAITPSPRTTPNSTTNP